MKSWPISEHIKADVLDAMPRSAPGYSNVEIYHAVGSVSIITIRRACQELYNAGRISRTGPDGPRKALRYYRRDAEMPERPWYPLDVTRLTLWWEEGVPTAEIGRRLRRGKASIAHKAHRLNLPSRASPIKPGEAVAPASPRAGLGPQPLAAFHPFTWGALEAQAERWR